MGYEVTVKYSTDKSPDRILANILDFVGRDRNELDTHEVKIKKFVTFPILGTYKKDEDNG